MNVHDQNQIGKTPFGATEGPQLVKSVTAAKMLAMCEKSVRLLAKRGEIPCIRNGRSLLLDIRDLHAWVERKKGAAKC